MMNLTEKTVEKRTIYKGRILNVRTDTVELPNGNVAFREMVEHSGGAAVLAVDDDNNIYLVKQYRYPYDEVIYEIPAGKLSKDELPLDCARRELTEETGITAREISLINTIYPSPGYTDEKLYIYLAKDLSYGETNLDLDEFVELEKLPFTKALEMVNLGIIKDCKTVVAIYNYALTI